MADRTAVMADRVAPPKSTGGGGFVFENDVIAWLLATMLVRRPVFGEGLGTPTQLDFQTRPNGWFLDDVLVTTAIGAAEHRFALSIKSNAQFKAKSAPPDFVDAAWRQWLHIGSSVFDANRDFLGIVTAPLSAAAEMSVRGLLAKARDNTPTRFSECLAVPRWATANERNLFASFKCPAELDPKMANDDTVRLLQRLLLIRRDFGADHSESESIAIDLCRSGVCSKSRDDARVLWSILREISSEFRSRGGSLTREMLVERLQPRVSLADYPDHENDWETLDKHAESEVTLVHNSIANRFHLPRKAQVTKVIDSLKTNDQVALLGSSGVGKSAIARAVYEHRKKHHERTLWIDAPSLGRAADFGAFEASLQLQHRLVDLLHHESGQNPLIIIDGLDRLCSGHAFHSVAKLIGMVRSEPLAVSWRILVSCQSQEWNRVHEELHRAGTPYSRWSTIKIDAPQPVDLLQVQEDIPNLKRLFSQPRVEILFTNLKLLDLVVRHFEEGTEIDTSSWVDESSVALWFWNAWIKRGADQLERSQFAFHLAETQANLFDTSVTLDAVDTTLISAAHSLLTDQIVVQSPYDRLTFAHDLYGDWIRFRILLNHQGDIVKFLQDRYELPLWHRAIRLLGIHLLERKNGVDEWKSLISRVDCGGMAIVRDVLVESPAFAMNAKTLLNSIFPNLVEGDGDLLRCLLDRFLIFATIPDERMLDFARSIDIDVNAARMAYRRPHLPCWLDILNVLHDNREEALHVAAPEVAKLVEMWLEYAPPGFIRRREAADLAVMLGKLAYDSHDSNKGNIGRVASEDRERFYRCALLATPEQPDEVADLAKAAACRIPRPTREVSNIFHQSRSNSVIEFGILRGPWPDGPLDQIDESFESVVLDGWNIRHLCRERPSVAREVVLATLISAPCEHWDGCFFDKIELDLEPRLEWSVPLYTQGPFLQFLNENFEEGLDLILRLVEFATDRSFEHFAGEPRNSGLRTAGDSKDNPDAEEVANETVPHHLVLYDGNREYRFSGDASSYGWSAGVTHPQGYSPIPPPAVITSLMALEQYFYIRMDNGEDISEELTKTLSRCRSVAPLGVLSDVGKRKIDLFMGPLRPLLSAPEIYDWEINKTVQGRSHLMIGAFRNGRHFVELAQSFNELKHRKRELRPIACELMFKSEVMQSFFSKVRDWWKYRRDNGETLLETVNRLELLFDPTKYNICHDPTIGTILLNTALEKIQLERSSELLEAHNQMLAIRFPIQCRTILDERKFQTDIQLESLWQTWLRIHQCSEKHSSLSGGAKRFDDRYVNAVTGGIAVFLWHEEWLSHHEERFRLIKSVIEAIIDELPNRCEIASELDISTWTWDCFLAEAAAILWARNPDDEYWRSLVAMMALEQKYATRRLLFSRCAEYREALGRDFERLRRIAIDWAHIRVRVDVLRGWRQGVPQGNGQLQKRLLRLVDDWIKRAVSSFVDGTLEDIPDDWSQFFDAKRFVEIDTYRHKLRDSRLMDFHAVRCTHEWLPLPNDALSSKERAGIIQFWQIALDIVTARLRAKLLQQENVFPCEDDVWVLKNVAAAVVQMQSNENPERFWMMIVDLPSEAHDWTMTFLNELHRCALSSEQPTTIYAPLIRQIVRHALSEVNGKMRWPEHEEVWDALLGIDWRAGCAWSKKHTGYVASIWDIIYLWMTNVPQNDRRLTVFAKWLTTPAASKIRVRTLPWFSDCVRANDMRLTCRDKETKNSLAKLLSVLWEQDQTRLRSTTEMLPHFMGLLTWLSEQKIPLGLELQGRIGDLV